MRMISKTNKMCISLALVAFFVISVIFLAMTMIVSEIKPYSSLSVNIEFGNESLIEQEKDNIDILFDDQNNVGINSRVNNGADSISERYLLIKDIDGSRKYLYAEYLNGGYAIYDRIGEFLFESSRFGNGPYDAFEESSDLYYGGPSYFYVKIGEIYFHTITNAEISAINMQFKSLGVNTVRQEYNNGVNKSMSLMNVKSSTNATNFTLGHKMPENHLLKQDVNFYFPILAMGMNYGYNSGDTIQVLQSVDEDGSKYNYTDAYMGKNLFGSCAFVALSMIMVFYDRIGAASMLPNNMGQLRLMYDYFVNITPDYYSQDLIYSSTGKYTGRLSYIRRGMMASEFLHQELLRLTFPQFETFGFDGLTEERINFAFNPDGLGTVYNNYRSRFPSGEISSYTYSSRNNTYLLPEKIVAGNPVIVWLAEGYPYQPAPVEGEPASTHAAVAYGFTGTQFLWYNVDSVLCNYGWDVAGPDYNGQFMGVNVNKSFIHKNYNLNVL